MKLTKSLGWQTIIMLVFIAANAFGLKYLIQDIGPYADLFSAITFLHLITFGLGVYRLADILTEERITEGFREVFEDEKIEHGKAVLRPARTGLRGAIAELVHCPSCTGVWVAMISFYLYLFFPTLVSAVMIIMALSAMERLTAKVYNLLEAFAKRG